MARTIRVEKLKKDKKKGRYLGLRAGSGDDRTPLISLGWVSMDLAKRAQRRAQDLEDEGRLSALFSLFDESKDKARRYLMDEGCEDLFGVSYHRMPLRQYVIEVFGPVRKEESPVTWKAEAGGRDVPKERDIVGYFGQIFKVLGDVAIEDLDRWNVADYIDGMRVQARGQRKENAAPDGTVPASGATKRLHRNAIKAVLRHAERQKHMTEIPNVAHFDIKGSSESVYADPEPLDLYELWRLMQASGERHRAMWALGAANGLAPSELCASRWEYVDWEAGENGKIYVNGTKNQLRAAVIPMTEITANALKRWHDHEGNPEEGPMFTYQGRQVSHFSRALKTAARKSGIDKDRARIYPYLLRHSFATICWCADVDRDTARRLMRHKDTSMIDQVYANPTPEQLAKKARAIRFPSDVREAKKKAS